MRLMLFLYCQVTQMTDLYCVPVNMLRIILGERYTMEPLAPLPKVPPPNEASL